MIDLDEESSGSVNEPKELTRIRMLRQLAKSKAELANLLETHYIGIPDFLIARSSPESVTSTRAMIACNLALETERVHAARPPNLKLLTAESNPHRIASVAMGTGEIDCVYHIALPELVDTVTDLEMEDARELLRIMIEGRRLKDMADLPLDLVI